MYLFEGSVVVLCECAPSSPRPEVLCDDAADSAAACLHPKPAVGRVAVAHRRVPVVPCSPAAAAAAHVGEKPKGTSILGSNASCLYSTQYPSNGSSVAECYLTVRNSFRHIPGISFPAMP